MKGFRAQRASFKIQLQSAWPVLSPFDQSVISSTQDLSRPIEELGANSDTSLCSDLFNVPHPITPVSRMDVVYAVHHLQNTDQNVVQLEEGEVACS